VLELGSTPLHDGPVSALAFSPSGERLLSVGGKTAALWDPSARRLVRKVSGPQTLTAAAFSPDGRTAFFATDQGHVLRWHSDRSSAEPVPGFACSSHLLTATELRLPEARRCPYGTFVEPARGRPFCAYGVTTLAVAHGTLARACREGTLGLLDLAHDSRTWYLAGYLRALAAVPPDGWLLGRDDGHLRLYRERPAKVTLELEPAGLAEAAASSGPLLAAAQPGAIRIWSAGSTEAVLALPMAEHVVWLGFESTPFSLMVLTAGGRLVAYPLDRQSPARR
jgi:hypothetical protein